MKKKPRKTKRSVGLRKPPANRQLTKEGVAAAMRSLRSAGAVITTKALLAACGGKGSFSTLLRLRKEVEAEHPDMAQNLGVSRAEALAFIEACDRSHLPALEEALKKRRRIIRFWRDRLVLEIDENQEAYQIFQELGAAEQENRVWSLEPTGYNFWHAKQYGFVATSPDVEANIMKELSKRAERAEYKR